MKNWLVLTLSALVVTGCQSIPDEQQPSQSAHQQQDEATAVPMIDTTPLAALLTPEPPLKAPVVVELSPQQEADVWQRIRRQLSLPIPAQARLDAQRDYYLKHPAYMNRVAERAAPFMHLIVDEIERRGLPLNLPYCLSWKAPLTPLPIRMDKLLASGSSFRAPRGNMDSTLIGGTTAAAMSMLQLMPPWIISLT